MANDYGNDSIDQLVGADRVRKRPAAMLGSAGLAGARHGFTEIYGNSLDERSAGFGNALDIKYYKDGSVSIRDYGRGVPLGWNNKRKSWNWHLVYNELYSGGKYESNQWYLQSLDGWCNWDDTNNRLDYLKNSFLSEWGYDIYSMDVNPDAYLTLGDMDICRVEERLFRTRVNNNSWASTTWDKLNSRLNYLASVGLNGLGAASTQYTSEYFIVKSYSKGKVTSREFRHGVPLVNGVPFDMFSATQEEIQAIPEEVEDTDEPDGTFIHWKPDGSVFDDVNLGYEWLVSVCNDITNVAGVNLRFENELTGDVIDRKSGDIKSLYKEHIGVPEDEDVNIFLTSNISHGRVVVEGDPMFTYVAKCDIAFGVVDKPVDMACYHNSVKMAFGVQYEGIEAAIGYFMRDKARRYGIKLEESDFKGKFAVFVSSYSNYASFRNQTKDAIDDPFIYKLIYDTFLEKLNVEYSKGNKELVDVIESAVKEAQLRADTKAWQSYRREADKVKREKAPQKFVSCRAYENKQYDKAELWITEGDSAKTSVVNARDSAFQAVYPIRGKGLNVLKSSIDRILKNKEIREIFSLIGTGFDLNIKGEKTFKIEDLRFDKIIFGTDADEDGYQIRLLLFLIFYRLAPDLIRQGHVYIAETPRFGIHLTDGTSVYAKDDAERDVILKEYSGRVKSVSRYKGLGEVNADVLRETTVHPDTRNLIPVTCDLGNDVERDLIDALFGMDKHHQRKEILSAILGLSVEDLVDDDMFLLQSDDGEEDLIDVEDNENIEE